MLKDFNLELPNLTQRLVWVIAWFLGTEPYECFLGWPAGAQQSCWHRAQGHLRPWVLVYGSSGKLVFIDSRAACGKKKSNRHYHFIPSLPFLENPPKLWNNRVLVQNPHFLYSQEKANYPILHPFLLSRSSLAWEENLFFHGRRFWCHATRGATSS